MKSKNQKFPTNRFKVFIDLFKNHKFELLVANLWFILFALLSIGLVYFYHIYSNAIHTFVNDGSMTLPTLTDGSVQTIDEYLMGFRTIILAVMMVTNIGFFLGLGGLQNVVQTLVFAEPIEKTTRTFFEGVRKNAKQFIGLSLIFSVVVLFSQFVVSFYLLYSEDFAVVISIAIATLLLVLTLILMIFAIPSSNLYRLTFVNLIRTAYGFYFVGWLKNIGWSLLLAIPLVMLLIPSTYFFSIWLIVLIFTYPPIRLIIYTLNFNAIADEKINIKQFPDIYRKGLFDYQE